MRQDHWQTQSIFKLAQFGIKYSDPDIIINSSTCGSPSTQNIQGATMGQCDSCAESLLLGCIAVSIF